MLDLDIAISAPMPLAELLASVERDSGLLFTDDAERRVAMVDGLRVVLMPNFYEDDPLSAARYPVLLGIEGRDAQRMMAAGQKLFHQLRQTGRYSLVMDSDDAALHMTPISAEPPNA